jgi:predicted lipid-binding transport protein (Tim44 family)
MYKLLGIGGFILVMLYNFFGLKGPMIILIILLVIGFLIVKNQNKILYMPSTHPNT